MAITRRATGSTICPGCNRRFANTPEQPTMLIDGQEANEGRWDSAGQKHRGIGTHDIQRRWHKDCFETAEAQNEAYRQQVKADDGLARSLAEAAGLDFEQIKREMEKQ